MTDELDKLAREIADRSGYKPTSNNWNRIYQSATDNWTRIYQAARIGLEAGMKLQRERDATTRKHMRKYLPKQ